MLLLKFKRRLKKLKFTAYDFADQGNSKLSLKAQAQHLPKFILLLINIEIILMLTIG